MSYDDDDDEMVVVPLPVAEHGPALPTSSLKFEFLTHWSPDGNDKVS